MYSMVVFSQAIRQSMASVVPDEPAFDCREKMATLRIRLPSGSTAQRRFLASNTLQDLLNYIGSMDYPVSDYKVLRSFYRTDVSIQAPFEMTIHHSYPRFSPSLHSTLPTLPPLPPPSLYSSSSLSPSPTPPSLHSLTAQFIGAKSLTRSGWTVSSRHSLSRRKMTPTHFSYISALLCITQHMINQFCVELEAFSLAHSHIIILTLYNIYTMYQHNHLLHIACLVAYTSK